MADVKRFDAHGCRSFCYGGYGMKEDEYGDYVLHEDYAALLARLELAEADVRRLNSGVIMTNERDEFGEEYKCERRGLNLRAMIDEAIEAGQR